MVRQTSLVTYCSWTSSRSNSVRLNLLQIESRPHMDVHAPVPLQGQTVSLNEWRVYIQRNTSHLHAHHAYLAAVQLQIIYALTETSPTSQTLPRQREIRPHQDFLSHSCKKTLLAVLQLLLLMFQQPMLCTYANIEEKIYVSRSLHTSLNTEYNQTCWVQPVGLVGELVSISVSLHR